MSVQIEGAVVKEQGTTFAIVVVKRHVIQNSSESRDAQVAFSRYFPDMPIILMVQDTHGVPTYYGRPDIVKFLAKIHPSLIPWKKYTFND